METAGINYRHLTFMKATEGFKFVHDIGYET